MGVFYVHECRLIEVCHVVHATDPSGAITEALGSATTGDGLTVTDARIGFRVFDAKDPVKPILNTVEP